MSKLTDLDVLLADEIVQDVVECVIGDDPDYIDLFNEDAEADLSKIARIEIYREEGDTDFTCKVTFVE